MTVLFEKSAQMEKPSYLLSTTIWPLSFQQVLDEHAFIHVLSKNFVMIHYTTKYYASTLSNAT